MLPINDYFKQETITLLRRLIGIESSNPPGNEDRIAAFAKAYLSQHGIEAIRVPLEKGRSSLVARIPGEEKGSVILCGHLDTVSTDEKKWRNAPLKARIKDNRLWGLGAADMKGGLAAIMEIAVQLVRQNVVPARDLVLVLSADEERAYRGAATVVASGLINDAELLIIAEPTAGHVYTGQKGELWVKITFNGQAAHGSMPELGVNTIMPAAAFCGRLHETAQSFPVVPGRGRTSLNIGQFNGGWQVNIVPDTTCVRLDFRVVSDKEREHILSLVKSLAQEEAAKVGATIESKTFNYQPLIASDANNPHIQRFFTAFTEVTGRKPESEIAPYSTDAVSIVPVLDIPVIIYGPGDIAQAHQPNEYLCLDSLYETLGVLARFLDPGNHKKTD